MKAKFWISLCLLVNLLCSARFVYADATKTVGSSGADYTTIKQAFDAVNSGTITGVITLQIVNNTSETASAVLNASGSGSATYSSITIYPTTSGCSISGSLAAPLIDLNGADNVTIDGRLHNSGGSVVSDTKDLTIVNTSTNAGSGTSTIRLINDATANVVKYCNLKGSTTDSGSGIIFLSTTTGSTGNDNNTIDHNNITSASDANRPVNAITSVGTSGKENNGNTYSNNSIFDFLNRANSSNGINLSSNTTGETISGNSFYETTSFVSTGSVAYSLIKINGSGGGFTISENYFGGSAASCSGIAWTKSGLDNILYVINITAANAPACSIQGNLIQNFNWTNSGSAVWAAIQITTGSANVGTVTGNTIGNGLGTGSIIVTNGATGASVYGINYAGAGIVNIQNNSIGSITAANANAAYATNFYGINKTNTAEGLISYNTIGSASTANSIYTSSGSTANAQSLIGINVLNGSNQLSISNNTIANLTNGTNSTDVSIRGLIAGISSASGINTFTNNTIHDLTISNANNASTNQASVCGITLTGTNALKTITGNTIYNLSNTYASFTGSIIGIYFGASGYFHAVSRNFIHSFSVSGSSSGASFYGLQINASASATYYNNIISLGGNSSTSIYGIYETGAASYTAAIYFNTVYLSGSPTSDNLNSFALYSASSAGTRNYRNNIFLNARSNSGASGKHYAAYFNYASSSGLTLDFNDYRVTGTGGVLGYYNSADQTAVPIVAGLDAKSLSVDPILTNPGTATFTDYKSGYNKLEGVTVSSITTDFLLINRAGTPTIGAFEGNLSLNIDVYKNNVYQSTYTRLKDAFDKINNGFHNGALELRIKASTTETATASLYASGTGGSNYSSVDIYPVSSGLQISGNIALPMIDFNGCSNVTLDGRVNATGSTKDLVVLNASTSSTSNTSTIRFINSANGNTVQYCIIKGASTGVFNGNVLFSGVSSGNGNTGNLIDRCDLTGADAANRPTFVIFSQGTTGKENSNNTISNCNFYNFLRPGGNSYGINLFSASNSFNITGNSFYETGAFTPTAGASYYIIKLNNTTGNNFNISNNYLGGSEANCGGSPWNITSAYSTTLYAIHIDVGTTLASSVQNNIIKNFYLSSTSTAPFYAIDANSGSVNIGTETGNTLGAPAGNGSITLNNANTTNAAISYGIYVNSAGTINIKNNSIGSFTAQSTLSSIAHSFYAVFKNGNLTGTITVDNNVIGSTTTANSIQAATVNTSAYGQSVYGVFLNGTGTNIVTNNTIANLFNAHAYQYSTNGNVVGISTSKGVNTIQNNTIRNLSSASPSNDATGNSAVVGISQLSTSASQTVSSNIIYDLRSTYTGSRTVNVMGIYHYGGTTGTNSIFGNFIHSFSAATGSASALTGIKVYAGSTSIYNNIVNLGTGITYGYYIYGIYENGNAGNNNNIWFNSVYIGGTASGTTASTYALYNVTNNNARDFRNNVLFNARTGGTTGKHYAIRLAGTATVTIDYNDYYVTGTNGVLGNIGTTDKTTLALWKAGTGQDLNSLNINPVYTNAGGTAYSDYYTSAALPGVSGTGITTDYDGLTRGSTPKMGALEANNFVWLGTVNSDFATPGNWSGGIVPPDGADITFASNPSNHCVLDQNRSVRNITNTQGTDLLVINGKKLTITGSLIFSGGAQIDASATSSEVVYAGDAAQSIPSGSFTGNLTANLTLNNANGLTLNGNLTVQEGLSLTSGTFTLGANTLTLNGNLTISAGSMTGGSSTNLTVEGTGVVVLPEITLNNLTLNRSTGLTLSGNCSVAGTLTLTAGTLTIGAYSLTISGNSPVKSAGNIDAGNAGSSVIFSNSGAITLPASTFSGALNNLSIAGTGGVTSAGDLTVSGILNLQSVNASTTKGCLDLWDGSSLKTLNLGIDASVTGTGDVTGIVKRSHTFSNGIDYSFGNCYTTLNFISGSSKPTSISCRISIGAVAGWDAWTPYGKVKRTYSFIQNGGGTDQVIIKLHYLDAELDATNNEESKLVTWHKSFSLTPHEHGKSNADYTNNYIGFASLAINLLAASSGDFDDSEWTLAYAMTDKNTWTAAGGNTDWNNPANWSAGHYPGQETYLTDEVLIPAGVQFYPALSSNIELNTIQIDPPSTTTPTVSADNYIITIKGSTGAWLNLGSFNAGTSTVIFTNANATMADPTNFYNVTIADGASLTLMTGNVMRIAGTLSLSTTGVLNAAVNENTIEYNGGAQTIINPNGTTPGYYHLILSGSSQHTKTLPSTPLNIYGDFTTSNTTGTMTISTGNNITIAGDVTVGSSTTFSAGAYIHSFAGNFENNGTYSASTGTAVFNGSSAQSITGSVSAITFNNLTVNSSNVVSIYLTVNVSGILSLANGSLGIAATTLGINGTINKTDGNISVSSVSKLSFGGTSAITLPNDLFSSTPSIADFTINRSGGVTLGNQSLTINGSLVLTSGTISLGSNTLTLGGTSPQRTNGYINASAIGATLAFTNTAGVTLPSSTLSGNVYNLSITGISGAGVTIKDNFTLTGTLSLLGDNPSATKGVLDMLDGSTVRTLTMGNNAVTIGLADVTGIVKRASPFSAYVPYSFGNQYTTITFNSLGSGQSYPDTLQAKITIGAAPSWKSAAIKRVYDFIHTGGSGCSAEIATHYLESELNNNSESELVHFTNGLNGQQPPGVYEWGRSNADAVNDWVAISNVDISYFPTAFGNLQNTLSKSELTSYSWNGSVSTNWTTNENWTPAGSPSSLSNVIIPDASLTTFSPTLPASVEIKTLTIEAAGILNAAASSQLTINGSNGAWINSGGTFNPSTGNVTFSNTAATLAGTTNFYNVTIPAEKVLWMQSGSTMKISGAVNNSGAWRTVISGETTVEYNGGAQTVVVPNPATNRYYNLVLSGSGLKTLPSSALNIVGNFNLSGTASTVVSSDITISGNATIGSGTSLQIDPNAHVTITGLLANSAGLSGLKIKSTAGGDGSLIHSNTGIQATVERYIPAWTDENHGWHFLSSPVEEQPISNFHTAGSGNDFYKWNEPTNEWINRTNLSGGLNGSFETNFYVGRGYLIANGTTSTKEFSGNLNVSNVSVTGLTNSSALRYTGWHLLGNPFSSSISFSQGTWNKVNIGTYAQIWNETNASYKVISGNQIIPPHNGFMVYTTGGGSLTIPADARMHGDSSWYKNSGFNDGLILTAVDDEGQTAQETIIAFNSEATNNFDLEYDSYFIAGFAPAFYSICGNDSYALNTLPENTDELVIPLGFAKNNSNQFKIVLSESIIGLEVFLTDLKEGTEQNLTQNPVYSFTSSSSDPAGRFLLKTRPTGIDETVDQNQFYAWAYEDKLHVSNLTEDADYDVIDISGRVIQSGTIFRNGSSQTIDLNGTSGLYLVRLRSQGAIKTIKFVTR